MKRCPQFSSSWLDCLCILSSLLPSSIGKLAEEQAIYLVILDGQPSNFHLQQAATFSSQHEDFKSKRESQEEHAKQLVQSHDKLLETLLDAGTYKKLYSFHHIINGFAVHTSPTQARRLGRANDEVLLIEKDRGARLMTTYTPHSLGLPERVWVEKGREQHEGEGILIGVVDTGIDPTHASFAYDPTDSPHRKVDDINGESPTANCDVGPQFQVGSCNGKLISARYFAAGAAASLPLNPSNLSPFDQVGHGSHVASIAAGNRGVPVVVNGFVYGFASGMAPRARLAIYKAMYPQGATLADLISAIDQAVQDGVDVLVLSIGPDEPPEDTLTFTSVFDIALLFARRAGVFVVQAAGNKGPGEATVVSFSPWAVGVAAGITGRTYTSTLVMSNGVQLHGVGLSAPTLANGSIQFKLVSARDATVVNESDVPITSLYAEECQHAEALQREAVFNSIVICVFSEGFYNGTSTMTAILDTATALEFAGFVLAANPALGDFIAEPLPFSLPGIMLPRIDDVEILWKYYEKHTLRDRRGSVIRYGGSAAIREGRIAAFGEAEPVVARFSSRGPDVVDSDGNLADVLKPDVLAPGHQIWAAWSPNSALDPILSGKSFALLSGTSMAAPHVAGVAALIKQRHPSWTPAMIASAMSTTARRHNNRGLPIMSQGEELYTLNPSTPFDHGAGLIDPSAALDPGLVFLSGIDDYVNFLCSLPNIDPALVKSITGVACNGSLSSPADLNLPSITVSALNGSLSVRRSVFNIGGKPETYMSSVLPPEGVEVSVHPPWFTIVPGGTQVLDIHFNVNRPASESFSFGEIVLTGSLDHIVRFPLSIKPIMLK